MLDKIIEATKKRADQLSQKYTFKYFEEMTLFQSPTISLKEYILKPEKNGIIAEFKRHSPSKGSLNNYALVSQTTVEYMRASCSALSILTEPEFFKGSNSDLIEARKFNFCPILRKDFIINPIQIFESRSIGADAILLIAKVLSKEQLKELYQCAKEIGLEIMIEINALDDLEKIDFEPEIIGINARNLSTMEIDSQKIIEIKNNILVDSVFVAESGISQAQQIISLKKNGFNGFLIGSHFMKSSDPGEACGKFCNELATLSHKKTVEKV